MHACGFSSLIRFSSQPSKKKWLGGSKPNIMWKYSDIFTYITSARAPIEPNSSLAVGSEPQTDPVLSNSSLRWGDKLARAIIQVASFTDRSSTAAEPLLCFVCMLPKMIRTTSKVGLRLFLSSSLKQWGASTSCSFRHCLLYCVHVKGKFWSSCWGWDVSGIEAEDLPWVAAHKHRGLQLTVLLDEKEGSFGVSLQRPVLTIRFKQGLTSSFNNNKYYSDVLGHLEI